MTSIDISFDVQARSTFHLPDHVTVVVNISDVNDNKPVFSNGTYSFTIAENAATGATVGQVKASDADQVSNTRTIDYALINSCLSPLLAEYFARTGFGT